MSISSDSAKPYQNFTIYVKPKHSRPRPRLLEMKATKSQGQGQEIFVVELSSWTRAVIEDIITVFILFSRHSDSGKREEKWL